MSALATLESARVDALKQRVFVEPITTANLPDLSRQPVPNDVDAGDLRIRIHDLANRSNVHRRHPRPRGGREVTPVESLSRQMAGRAVKQPAAAALDLIPRRTIDAINVVKEFPTEGGGKRRVLDGISFSVGMGERMAILGRNGAGKSTLIKILSGLQRPTSGQIHRGLHMSWPLAFGGGFEGELTGADNVRLRASTMHRSRRRLITSPISPNSASSSISR
jgi:ABC-type multidrug transport system fused ATPase/permease subunit